MPHSPPTHRYAHQVNNRKQQQREYNRTKRTNQSFYSSAKWTKVSKWYRRNNPLCEDCKDQGITTLVDVVDHIVELQDGGEPLRTDNLRSLCHLHHNRKTALAKSQRG